MYVNGELEDHYFDIVSYQEIVVLEDYFAAKDSVKRVEIRLYAEWRDGHSWSDTVVFEHRREDHPRRKHMFEEIYIR